MMEIRITPVGFVRSPRADRTDVDWGAAECAIELDPAEIVYFMHGIPESQIVCGARHPRENRDWPRVGIFAQRGAKRPNRIGVSRCKVLCVDGLALRVRGLDAIDGTPVIDIKPYMREFGPIGPTVQPLWATQVMQRYFDD